MASATFKSSKAIQLVPLVTLEVMTPYKAGEVFAVPPAVAKKLLKVDMTKTDFGPKYPRVKVRLYNPDRDEPLNLSNGTLNQEEHKKLLQRLHPELVEEEDEEDNSMDADDSADDDLLKLDDNVNEFSAVTQARKAGRPRKNA